MFKKIALILMLIAPMSVFAQKFGHINSQEIMSNMPEYKKAQTDIQTMEQQYKDEIQRAMDDLNKKYAAFQEEQATLPQNIKDRRMKELQELNEKGIQFQNDASQQLQQSWMEMLQPIAKKIDDAIKAVGQEGGYVYIFDLGTTNIPYVSSTLSTDVTANVKAKLGLQ